MAKKFYAVKRGVRPGVYETWSACEPLVKGFPGAIYKSFPTRQDHGERYVLQGHGDDPEMASMRNVAGEILGAMAAVKLAVEKGLPELAIYYDYLGIEMWATGGWKRNKTGTIAYYDYMQQVRDKLRVTFIKVKGHSGVEGNEEADRLAKEAVGITG